MHFLILTVFPQVIKEYCNYGIVKQARKKELMDILPIDLRNYAHRGKVDDEAYGGLPGMVLKPEPIFRAYEHIANRYGKPYTIIPQPWGKRIDQETFHRLKNKENILIVCGRYEGIDERVSALADEELSLGDFVLSGGELLALVLVDGIARLLPGAVGEPESLRADSFGRWLGYPVYTRPKEFGGLKVPDVLLSGNHRFIELWKLWHSIERTIVYRPDLIPKDLTPLEKEIVDSIRNGSKFEDWIKRK
ncbi:MAG: tRNA (guanosine(37)-N1)-methyltransferase TrmD [Aquificaceae bacterium]